MTKSRKKNDKKDQLDGQEDLGAGAAPVADPDMVDSTSEPDSTSDAKDAPEGASEPAHDGDSDGATVPEDGDAGADTSATELAADAEPAAADPQDATDATGASDAADDTPDTDDQPPEDSGSAQLEAALATAPLISSGAIAAAPVVAPNATSATGADGDDHDHGDDHNDDHEEEHRSLASRVLTWLVLLLVGGGIALWGAPKIAPHLPDGLGPVKAWLMPGALETESRIAALEAEMDRRFAALPPPLAEDDVAAAVGNGVAALESSMSESLQVLEDKVNAADSASIEGRLTKLEAGLQGLSAQIEALSGLSADATLSDEQISQLGSFAGLVEGLRAELGVIADQQGALNQRIDDVEVTVERKLTQAEQEVETAAAEAEVVKNAALARASLTSINAALRSGDPFEESLGQLEANADVEVPAGLRDVAAIGVTPLDTLRNGFADAAHAALRADVQSRDTASVGGRLAAFIEAQVASRSLTPQEGNSTDAILSRAEDALRRSNLAAAVEELATLPAPAREAMGGWLSRAQARVAAVSAVDDLTGKLAAEN